MGDSGGIFAATLDALGAGLHVGHIAEFGLHTCNADDDVDRVFQLDAAKHFDQIPVRGQHDRIVGVVERQKQNSGGKVVDQMRHLDDSILISSTAPLYAFIRAAKESHYRLVLTEHGVTGIVTGSDLLKLPARLLAFAFVTHVESTMARLIQTRHPAYEMTWLNLLDSHRQRKIHDKLERQRTVQLDPEPLELTEFCDKREIVAKTFQLGSEFAPSMRLVEKLRNKVAHAASFVDDDEANVEVFAVQMETAHRWITLLEQRVTEEQKNKQ